MTNSISRSRQTSRLLVILNQRGTQKPGPIARPIQKCIDPVLSFDFFSDATPASSAFLSCSKFSPVQSSVAPRADRYRPIQFTSLHGQVNASALAPKIAVLSSLERQNSSKKSLTETIDMNAVSSYHKLDALFYDQLVASVLL